MTKANTYVVAKIVAVVAGLALVATAFVPAARAQSSEEQIAALMAQIAALQAQAGGSSSASVTFTRDLTLGSTGADVTALQNWLISKGHSIPAGATGYFGAQTQAALAAYQASAGISPAAGYFGPITRAKVNAAGGASTGGDDDDDDDDDSDNELDGGEASLEDLQANDGEEDEVELGGSAQVAEFEFDVEDADIEIQRLDLTFDSSAVGGDDDDEPWDVFGEVTISIDGDEVASEDVSDEDEWLDDDGTNGEYVFRFTGLDSVVNEGETGVITVTVEADGGADLGSNDLSVWQLYIDTDGLRGTDGEGIEQYLGDATEDVTFDVVEEGADDELTVRRSSNDPDAATLQVEDDGSSDWHTVLVFELEADEDGGDIEIDTIPVDFTVSTGEAVSSMINDAKLVIDGEEFDDYDFTNAADTFGSTTFDIDGDVTVESGETVEVEVMLEFNSPTSGSYDEGDEITASVEGANIDAEGADDITVGGSVTGDTHNLRSTGVDITKVSDSAEENDVDGSDNDFAEFEITVEVEAFEQDVYVSATSSAFTYQIENADGSATSTGTFSATVSSDADTDSGFYVIDEGSSEEVTFRVTFNPAVFGESADYRMQLLTVVFNDEANFQTQQTWTASPASEYETDYAFVAD